MSPDGANLLVRRTVPTAGGHSEIRYSTMPFEGGAEAPLPVAGTIRRATWSDAQHVATSVVTPGGLRLSEADVRSGATRNVLDLTDSVLVDFAALPNGWAWIPPNRDRIVVSEGGRRREYRVPAWFSGVGQLVADGARRRVLYSGFGRATGDSIGAAMLSLDDGKHTHLASRFAENGRVVAVDGHEALFLVGETQDSWSLFAIDGPGAIKPLGTVGLPINWVSVSRDLSRASVVVRDYRADAWLNKVVVR